MVLKIIELIGVSKDSFADAIAEGVKRSSQTVKNITGVDVAGQSAKVKDGELTEFRVNLKVAFIVE